MVDVINKASLQVLKDALLPALQKIAAEQEITINWGGGTYTDTGATLKLELALIQAADGQPTGKEADAFRSLAIAYGFLPSDLGRKFHNRGVTHQIIGLKSGASKRPIITSGSDGKRYVWPHEIAHLLLEKSAI
jgi:hypothetical protein